MALAPQEMVPEVEAAIAKHYPAASGLEATVYSARISFDLQLGAARTEPFRVDSCFMPLSDSVKFFLRHNRIPALHLRSNTKMMATMPYWLIFVQQ